MWTVACPGDPSFPSRGLCCRQGAVASPRTPSGSGAFPCDGACVWSSDLLWAFGPFAAPSREAVEMSIPLGPFADNCWVQAQERPLPQSVTRTQVPEGQAALRGLCLKP